MSVQAPRVRHMRHSPALSSLAASATQRVGPGRVLPPLADIIDFLNATAPQSWWAGPTFRSECGTQHCVLSHIFEKWGSAGFDEFEDRYSTSYVIGGVINDKPSEAYPQAHPKERVVAYLNAMLAGVEMTTHESMDFYAGPDPSLTS